jgi:hypothetical protein
LDYGSGGVMSALPPSLDNYNPVHMLTSIEANLLDFVSLAAAILCIHIEIMPAQSIVSQMSVGEFEHNSVLEEL